MPMSSMWRRGRLWGAAAAAVLFASWGALANPPEAETTKAETTKADATKSGSKKTEAARSEEAAKSAAARPDGRELFTREWIPGDKRSHGGDGLGPLFNESSCVACHNQGGVGGAGPASKNAQILTAFPNPIVQQQGGINFNTVQMATPQTLPQRLFQGLFGNLDSTSSPSQPQIFAQPTPVFAQSTTVAVQAFDVNISGTPGVRPLSPEQLAAIERERKELGKLHPGLATSPSVVLHRAATYGEYESWRQRLAQNGGGFQTINMLTSGDVVTFTSAGRAEGVAVDADVDPFGPDTKPDADPSPRGLTPLREPPRAATSELTPPRAATPRAESPRPTAPRAVEGPRPPVPVAQPSPPIAVSTVPFASMGGPGASFNPQAMNAIQMQKQEAQMSAQRRVFNQAQQHGNFAVVRSERNTSPLFGSGLIDAVTDDDLKALEAKQAKESKVSGRASPLKDGKLGRFGWKGQIASLDDFVLTACAVEVGLNVPGHAQAGLPHKPDYKTEGLDLNSDECQALIRFVRDLPAPKQRSFGDDTDKEFVTAGHKLFTKIGCAACHVDNVGKAEGLFSDLLLHDMGPDLGDSGSSYGIFVPDSTPEGTSPAPQGDLVTGDKPEQKKIVSATRQEWRTPPLWGVRDSAPYLHDGRAETLEQAVAFHGGESSISAQQFFSLSAEERFKVVTFLKSLVAPDTTQPVVAR